MKSLEPVAIRELSKFARFQNAQNVTDEHKTKQLAKQKLSEI